MTYNEHAHLYLIVFLATLCSNPRRKHIILAPEVSLCDKEQDPQQMKPTKKPPWPHSNQQGSQNKHPVRLASCLVFTSLHGALRIVCSWGLVCCCLLWIFSLSFFNLVISVLKRSSFGNVSIW